METFKNILVVLITLVFFFACNSSQEQNEDAKIKPNKSEYAQGTAGIKAELISIENDGDHLLYRISVSEVSGYGSSTPPINNEEYKMKLSKSLQSKLDGDYHDTGKLYFITVRYSEQMGKPEGSWEIININNITL